MTSWRRRTLRYITYRYVAPRRMPERRTAKVIEMRTDRHPKRGRVDKLRRANALWEAITLGANQ